MASKCEIKGCNNPVWGNGLCANHKPKKPLPNNGRGLSKGSVRKSTDKRNFSDQIEFFLQIWKKRPHKSEISGESLGEEPLTIFFHHILPKEKYPEACFDEDNIIILSWQEHDTVERDMYRYPEINKRRELLKIKYERA